MERVALVTGANAGIGWAVARRLAADGFRLGFHTRARGDEHRERFEEISRAGEARWVTGDLSDPDTPERLVAETADAFGRLDVLVNNAGVTSAKPVLELTAQDFDHIFGVDVRGAFLLALAAARTMRESGGGSIVNVTSVHELVPRPGFALYAPAKAALGMLSRSLALELAGDGIRVNSVAPGVIATARNEEASELAAQVPLARAGTPEEVAAVVSFLAGDGGMIQQVVSDPAW